MNCDVLVVRPFRGQPTSDPGLGYFCSLYGVWACWRELGVLDLLQGSMTSHYSHTDDITTLTN